MDLIFTLFFCACTCYEQIGVHEWHGARATTEKILGSFSNDDADGSENITLKMNMQFRL